MVNYSMWLDDSLNEDAGEGSIKLTRGVLKSKVFDRLAEKNKFFENQLVSVSAPQICNQVKALKQKLSLQHLSIAYARPGYFTGWAYSARIGISKGDPEHITLVAALLFKCPLKYDEKKIRLRDLQFAIENAPEACTRQQYGYRATFFAAPNCHVGVRHNAFEVAVYDPDVSAYRYDKALNTQICFMTQKLLDATDVPILAKLGQPVNLSELTEAKQQLSDAIRVFAKEYPESESFKESLNGVADIFKRLDDAIDDEVSMEEIII